MKLVSRGVALSLAVRKNGQFDFDVLWFVRQSFKALLAMTVVAAASVGVVYQIKSGIYHLSQRYRMIKLIQELTRSAEFQASAHPVPKNYHLLPQERLFDITFSIADIWLTQKRGNGLHDSVIINFLYDHGIGE